MICKLNSALFIIFFLVISISAQNLQQLKTQLNPDFIKYQKMTDEEKESLSIIPVPYSYKREMPNNFKFNADLPTRFDLREEGYLTSVKDQSVASTCWAFSTMGAIESRWLKLGYGSYDLSENNLKNRHGYLRHPNNDGGNYAMASSYLSAILGPVLETEDPYDPFSTVSPTNIPPTAFISEAWYPPTLDEGISLENAINITKQIIFETAPLYCPIYYDQIYYNSSNYTYYCNIDKERNHAILLVGWDDNKVTDAPQPGAWIVKNTYGTSYGENGYFYLSYYDHQVLTQDLATWPVRRDYNANSYLYRHDALGGIGAIGWDTHDFGLVKFEVENNLPITNIMTWAYISNMTISIYIYDEFQNGNLSGLLSQSTNNYFEYAGYYLIELPEPLNLPLNDDFYVKVEYSHESFDILISDEVYLQDYCDPEIKVGVNWISTDGINWIPIGVGTQLEANLAIRAYASQPGAAPVITTNQTEMYFEVLPNTTETGYLKISNQTADGGRSLVWKIKDEDVTLQLVNDNLNKNWDNKKSDLSVKAIDKVEGKSVELKLNPSESTTFENDVSLVLDDGTLEQILGLQSGGQIIWLNRFTPNQDKIPFDLNEVWVMFYQESGVNVGDLIDIYIYEDKDGDNDPATNANLIGSIKNAAVQENNGYTFSQFPLDPIKVEEACDIIIAVVNRTAGTSPGEYPAALDGSTSQLRSWLGAYYGDPPDPPTLPANGLWDLADNVGYPGNWLIRGYGTTEISEPNCEWVTEFPENGTITCGSDQIIEVTVDAAGMNLGSYQANLIIENNDPLNPTLTIPVTMDVVSVLSAEEEDKPNEFYLSQNYPNPFNPATKIKFSILHSQITILKVYDILGREIKTLINKQMLPGEYEIEFDASGLNSGIYFYQLISGQFCETRKMIILK